MDNNLMLVITNEENTLQISLKYCNDMKVIVCSNNIKNIHEFYKNNNIDINNNLITTLETRIADNYMNRNYNQYDNVFNSILFFSKIINKMYSTNKVKYNIYVCVSKKHVKRALIICKYLLKIAISIKFIYDTSEMMSLDDLFHEKKELRLFYQSPYYKE